MVVTTAPQLRKESSNFATFFVDICRTKYLSSFVETVENILKLFYSASKR